MELKITQERVLDAASKSSTAKETLKLLFPEAFKNDDNNAFVKEFDRDAIEDVSIRLFEDEDALQILVNATPRDLPELKGRAFFVDKLYEVGIGEAAGGTYIAIFKK